MDGYVTDMTAYETVDYLTKIQELLQKEYFNRPTNIIKVLTSVKSGYRTNNLDVQ